MLFNSYTFLIVFLPLTLLVFQLLRRGSQRVAMGWLVLSSLIYYGVWNPDPERPWTPFYLLLICGSCLANFFIGRLLAARAGSSEGRKILAVGLIGNLSILFYFKYIGLFEKTMAALTGGQFFLPEVILPLGLSFFTFQKIAFLVDAYRGETKSYNFLDFLLFVTFFPQLIAGPIVHHKEIMPQIQRRVSPSRRSIDLSIGLSLFAMGLFKKVVIADNLAPIATRLFTLAAHGDRDLTMAEAWVAGVTYALQLYFDFSGYSDMAIGGSRLFGIRLPINFHSPYKATSIVDFWRRWHITLSRFLRDYLYFSLGGNRKGPIRRYSNLITTMLLGGLWHGAGWTYVIWGGIHGALLCINHAWFGIRKKFSIPAVPKPLAILMTFFVVVLAWVPFRAGAFELGEGGSTRSALDATQSIFASMFGLNGWASWPDASAISVEFRHAMRAVSCILIVWLLPNSQEVLRRYRPAMGVEALSGRNRSPGPRRFWHWRPTASWSALIIILFLAALYEFDKLSEFIYFQF
ncbi:MAG: MBOAT family protein [Verrucomicrobia bacterium]|nr:MAG: MBOAT family protein [Verrucomicrobiota bacterium]TAE88905.1 MAG: MBOAT family protein [Verrucomicrobiota bacterium]TAF27322.1 MAG: MBOAT family protein [Verrucomicrobiota bacterium]TAF42387.1 MAG: MBOAT family protein [Verrucomicrobiota bacterium]